MSKLTKAEVVAALAEHTDLPKAKTAQVLSALETLLTAELAAGNAVPLLGGVFQLSEVAERQGVKPGTTEAMTIAAHKRVKFKAGTALKGLVNS